MASGKVVGFGGNTRRPSKTRALIEAVGTAYSALSYKEVEIYDVLDVGLAFGSATSKAELSEEALAIIDAVETADALIVGTPVYKGAYSGHFKHFFDLINPDALVHTPVCLTATGGGHRHALIVDHHLRPLFGFFSALTLPTSVYACDQDFVDGVPANAALQERIDRAAAELFLHSPANQKALKTA
jgi:FMN reductase